MKPVIEVKGVWKEYLIGIDRKYRSLRDTFINLPGTLYGDKKEKFWALQDISFEVESGQSIGIIGRNGAGKSTLLKILSRITPPTKGEVILRGRVASLLEVGTGFHPELTGRENIFFNGSVLGMKNAEIKRKMDVIVDFSGVEAFLDTPLKHYSSGMQLRLAFSVAAHLDADILLIDEILAVGDAEFQKKSIGKMDEISHQNGKTILFVSHNLSQIKQLTTKSILLDKGIQQSTGPTDDIINLYHENILNQQWKMFDIERNQTKDIVFSNCTFLDKDHRPLSQIETGQTVNILIQIQNNSNRKLENVLAGLLIRNIQGSPMTGFSSNVHGLKLDLEKGENTLVCSIDKFPLSPGFYIYNLILTKGSLTINWMKEAGTINVVHGFFFETGEIPSPALQTVLVDHKWKIE